MLSDRRRAIATDYSNCCVIVCMCRIKAVSMSCLPRIFSIPNRTSLEGKTEDLSVPATAAFDDYYVEERAAMILQ